MTPAPMFSKICPWLTEEEFEARFQHLQQRLREHSQSTGLPIQTIRDGKPVLLFPDGRLEIITTEPVS